MKCYEFLILVWQPYLQHRKVKKVNFEKNLNVFRKIEEFILYENEKFYLLIY